MTIDRGQSLALGVGGALLLASAACPPHGVGSGLFGGIQYIPFWDHVRPVGDTGIDWNPLILQATAILEAVFTVFILFRRPGISKGQIGSVSVCGLAAVMVATAYLLNPHSLFEPVFTLILLNLVGIVSATMSVVVRGLGL